MLKLQDPHVRTVYMRYGEENMRENDESRNIPKKSERHREKGISTSSIVSLVSS